MPNYKYMLTNFFFFFFDRYANIKLPCQLKRIIVTPRN